MKHRVNGLEWLALSAVAQQKTGRIRSHSLRVYLRETLGIARPLSFIQGLTNGGLLEYDNSSQYIWITEWGFCARRVLDDNRHPQWLPVPRVILDARQGKRLAA